MARQFTYSHGDKTLVLEPLKGQIDPSKSDYTVGKVKVEVRLIKMAHGRWGALVGDAPDRASPRAHNPDMPVLTFVLCPIYSALFVPYQRRAHNDDRA